MDNDLVIFWLKNSRNVNEIRIRNKKYIINLNFYIYCPELLVLEVKFRDYLDRGYIQANGNTKHIFKYDDIVQSHYESMSSS